MIVCAFPPPRNFSPHIHGFPARTGNHAVGHHGATQQTHSYIFRIMSEDLLNEQEAINSIYGEHTFEEAPDQVLHQCYLAIPPRNATLRLFFPPCYPDKAPQILCVVKVGDGLPKGYGTNILAQAREALTKVFIPGAVCIFDLLQALECNSDESPHFEHCYSPQGDDSPNHDEGANRQSSVGSQRQSYVSPTPPEWAISSTVTSKKSVFVAHACSVTSPSQTKTALIHLLSIDKRIEKATHNITSYRIRRPASSATDALLSNFNYQDYDDGGETAAGGRLLHLLKLMDVWDVFVVVSRWYGGVRLGPVSKIRSMDISFFKADFNTCFKDRFRLISQVAREVIVEGGWSKGQSRAVDVSSGP